MPGGGGGGKIPNREKTKESEINLQKKKVYNHLVICDTLRNLHHVLVEGTAKEIFALSWAAQELSRICTTECARQGLRKS